MKEYEVINLKDEAFSDVVILNTTEDMYYYLKNIVIYDDKFNYPKKPILVDLVMRNGYQWNRFVEIRFYDGFVKTFIASPLDVSDNIKLVCANYLKNNIELLNESALSQRAITIIKNILSQKKDLKG